MSRKKEATYELVLVKEIPKAKKARETIYDDMIKELAGKPSGSYEVKISGKKSKTIYSALAKRDLKGQELKLVMRGERIFIEKF